VHAPIIKVFYNLCNGVVSVLVERIKRKFIGGPNQDEVRAADARG
jgi:hypothetical protein